MRVDQSTIEVTLTLNPHPNPYPNPNPTPTRTRTLTLTLTLTSTIQVEKKLLAGMKDPEQIAKFTEVEKKIEDQVERLDKLLVAKSSAPRGCSDDKARLAPSNGYPITGDRPRV